MPDNFKMHEDAGHGWLEVPRAALKALHLEDKITGYSYQDGDTVFLEEDQDAVVFVSAYLLSRGKKEHDFSAFSYDRVFDGDYSWIRNLRHYEK